MPRTPANGINIAYESLGRADDPTILLIHGFATPLTGWPDSLCQALAAQRFRVVLFDNRDVGRSTFFPEFGAPDLAAMIVQAKAGARPSAPYALAQMADDAARLLDALRIRDAHVVGASMGGMIAQLVAIRHPDKTKSLVSIMSTTGRPGLPQAKSEAMRALTARPASPAREDRLATALAAAKAIGGPSFAASDDERRGHLGRSIDYTPYDPAAAARQMAAIIAASPRSEALKRVDAPALVIHGADDPLIPVEHGEDTAKSLPHAKLLVVAGLGHDFTESACALFGRAIGEFTAEVEDGAEAAGYSNRR